MKKEQTSFWTREQCIKFFVNEHVEKQDIQSLTCAQLVQGVYHQLNQRSAIASGYVDVLLHQGNYGFVNDTQKDLLVRLERELQEIRILTEMIGIWLSEREE